MSNTERTKMLFFLKDHISDFDGMTREEVANICMEGLGTHVNSGHIKTGRVYLEASGIELWTESRNRKGYKQKENEKLMADVKLLTKKIDIILQYLPLNARKKLQLNDEEYKSFCNAHLAETPSMEEWAAGLKKEN